MTDLNWILKFQCNKMRMPNTKQSVFGKGIKMFSYTSGLLPMPLFIRVDKGTLFWWRFANWDNVFSRFQSSRQILAVFSQFLQWSPVWFYIHGCIVPCTTKSLLASRDLLIRPRHGLRHLSRFSKSILTSIFLAPIYQFLKKQLNPNENYSKISSEAFSGQDWYMIMMFIWYFFVVKMSDNDSHVYKYQSNICFVNVFS